MSRLSTRRKDSFHCGNINSLPSPLFGRRTGRPGDGISAGAWLGVGGAPARIVTAPGHDVPDLEPVNDTDR